MDSRIRCRIQTTQAVPQNPSLLSRPARGDTLSLYLAINSKAVSTVLLHDEEGTQRPVYYVSRALQGTEERYSLIERAAFTMLVTTRKLRPYFQAHTVIVLTNLPLKKTLQKVEASGRLTQWAIELSEFDIPALLEDPMPSYSRLSN